MWKQGQANNPASSLQRNPKLSAQFEEGDVLEDVQSLQFGSFVEWAPEKKTETQTCRTSEAALAGAMKERRFTSTEAADICLLQHKMEKLLREAH